MLTLSYAFTKRSSSVHDFCISVSPRNSAYSYFMPLVKSYVFLHHWILNSMKVEPCLSPLCIHKAWFTIDAQESSLSGSLHAVFQSSDSFLDSCIKHRHLWKHLSLQIDCKPCEGMVNVICISLSPAQGKLSGSMTEWKQYGTNQLILWKLIIIFAY